MADTKIASLTDGLTTSGTDRIPVAISPYGSGNNAYITPSYLKTFMVTGGTVTSSTPVFDMTQTWNSGAVTFSGLKLNITDTASASASLLMDLQVGGSSKFKVDKTGSVMFPNATTFFNASGSSGIYFGNADFRLGYINTSGSDIAINASDGIRTRSSLSIGWGSSSADAGSAADLRLWRDAANTLALQNGTSAQTLNIYNTWSSAGANYEALRFTWAGSTAFIQTVSGGTGAGRDIQLLAASGTVYLRASKLLFYDDNTYDIGASGANRPRNLYVAGTATVGGSVSVANGSGYLTAGLGGYYAQSDGVIKFQNNAGADFGRIQLGGTTSSFPAIKRSGPAVAFRRADDTIGTFADLPAAASGNEGAVYSISDCNTSTWGATAAGGGSTHAMVRSNGTNWTVIGV